MHRRDFLKGLPLVACLPQHSFAGARPDALAVNEATDPVEQSGVRVATHRPPFWPTKLDPDQTFDSFVVGKTNEKAYAAARAVSGHSGAVINPLWIHGSRDMGKTHLLNAVGMAVRKSNPQARVLLVPFSAICLSMALAECGYGHSGPFEVLESVDLLLLIDTDFHATIRLGDFEEQFVRMTERSIAAGRQVVISSTVPPDDLRGIARPLVSLLDRSTIVGIEATDRDLRMNFLRANAIREDVVLSDDVAGLIARRFARGDMRTLNVALGEVIADSRRHAEGITMRQARRALSGVKLCS